MAVDEVPLGLAMHKAIDEIRSHSSRFEVTECVRTLHAECLNGSYSLPTFINNTIKVAEMKHTCRTQSHKNAYSILLKEIIQEAKT